MAVPAASLRPSLSGICPKYRQPAYFAGSGAVSPLSTSDIAVLAMSVPSRQYVRAMIELLTTAEMAEADRLAIAGGIAGIDADGEGRPGGGRSRSRAIRSAAASWWWRARATMAATGSWPRGFWPSAAIACACCCSASASGSRATRRWRRSAGTGPIEPATPDGASRRADVDRRCAVRRGPRPAGRGRGARHDRGDECERRADLSRSICRAASTARPAPSWARPSRRPRPSPSSGASPGICCCRAGCIADGSRRRHRHSGHACSSDDQAARPSSTSRRCGARISGAAARRSQIFARPCGGAVRRRRFDRRGAACGARRAAGRRGAGDHRRSPREALAVNAAASLAVMVRPVDGAAELAELPRRCAPATRSCSGPGGGVGRRCASWSRAALAGERAVVLDADALTSFADEPQALFAAIRARPSDRGADPARGRVHATLQDRRRDA